MSVVVINHVVAVRAVNVAREKSVNQISACVVQDEAVVVHMNLVLMEDVFVKQIHVINVIMHVNQMKFVLMGNVSVKVNAETVGDLL